MGCNQSYDAQDAGSINDGVFDQGDTGTCYAAACAKALFDTESRIPGRKPEDMLTTYRKLVSRYGYNGYSTNLVLRAQCPSRGLRVEEVGISSAIEAVRKGRRVVASFTLTKKQWKDFRDFYIDNPGGVLDVGNFNTWTNKQGRYNRYQFSVPPALRNNERGSWLLNIFYAPVMLFNPGNPYEDEPERPRDEEKPSGHAVVFVGVDGRDMIFQNSWGKDWAQGGRFKVSIDALGTLGIDMSCYDVYFLESDLTADERRALHRQK